MKPRMIFILLAGALLAWWSGGERIAAQDNKELVKAVQKATADLVAAEKTVIAARNALQGSRNSLDTNQFNSAAYNARITAAQVKAAKEKLDKAGPKDKLDYQEKYELALELAEQRKAALAAAEKLLPQREAAAKAAEEKYAAALPAAQKLAGQYKELFHQAENAAVDKLIAAKLATEKAAFAKAKAEQRAEVHTKLLKVLAALTAANKAVGEINATLHKAPAEADKARKVAEVTLKIATKERETAQEKIQKTTAAVKAAEQAIKEAQASVKGAQQALKKAGKKEKAAAEKLVKEKAALLLKAEQTAKEAQVAAQNAKTVLDTIIVREKAAAKLVKDAVAAQEKVKKDLPKILAGAEKAVKTFAAAVHTAEQHLPAVQKTQVFKVTLALLEADKEVQKTAAALNLAKQEVQKHINAVKARTNELKAAQERLQKRIAKIRARKDLKFAQESLGRAEASKAKAEKLLPPVIAEAEKAQTGYAAALQTALKMLVQSTDAAKVLAADQASIAKALANQEAEYKKEYAVLTREAAEAQKAMDQANAVRAAADQVVNQHRSARATLERALRARFYREVTKAGEEVAKSQGGVATAQKTLNAKLAAFNKAVAVVKNAKENAANARKTADAQAAVLLNATKERTAAEQLAQKTAAAAKTAAQQAKEAQAAAEAAQAGVKKAPVKEKAKAEKLAKEKAAAAKTAALKAKEAQAAAATAKTAWDKINTKVQAADKAAKAAAKTATAAEQKAAAAQTACDKTAAEKTAAEQVVWKADQALGEALTQLAIAKSAAQGGLKPLPQSAWDYAKARHLMVRAGFGGTPDEIDRLHKMGLYRAVDHLVNFNKLPPADISFAAYPKERPEEYEKGLSPQQRQQLQQRRIQKEAQQIQSMRTWWLRRMIESPRPLEEKLTLFWHNHFATQYSTVANSYHMYLQNQLFRENAAGNFATLLHGITHDAAMLNYLNNDTNVKGRPNENLAREIMELFSMGRDQGYSEIDIRQGAKALTGYTYDPWTGQFRFIKNRHEPEPKTIFGKTGDWAGDDFATLILETPYPPKFIARQLFKFFAHDEPDIETVEALANLLIVNNYELAPMLENLFLSEEFYSAKAMGTQIKSPLQLVVGLHRDLGLKNPDLPYLVSSTNNMGQLVFEPPSVFGWPPGRAWVNSTRVFARYNALGDIIESRPRAGKTGVDVVGTLLAGKQLQTHAEVVDYLVRSCMTVPLPETKRQALIQFLSPLPPPAKWAAQPGPVNARLTHLLAILACSPEYQLT